MPRLHAAVGFLYPADSKLPKEVRVRTITAAALTVTVLGLAAGLRVTPADAQEPDGAQPPASQAQPAPATAPAARPKPCTAPEAHQFDFWIGDWDLATKAPKPDGTWQEGKATNSVRAILDGCVIQENFDNRPEEPYQGTSISMYSPQLGKWQQTWVDNAGAYLDFVGGWKDGKMVLTRSFTLQGRSIQQRMTYHDIKPDSFDWDWERSLDGGATWMAMWKIHYARKK